MSVDWILIEKKKECTGSEINKGSFLEVTGCAESCRQVSSMFVFGTNEFGTNRCDESGCACYCETAATNEGDCQLTDHEGYNLFKFENFSSLSK